MAQLQKGQSYPDMGFRVDDKGIAYDLKTGASLAKADVNARLASSGTGMSNLDTKRGGVAGFYDKNKSWAVPAAELIGGVLSGGATIPAMIGAGAGLNSIKHPDLAKAALGGVSGYGIGKVGAGIGGALGMGGASASGAPILGSAGSGASNVANAAVGGGGGGAGNVLTSILGKVGGLPGVSSATNFLTGNNGLNALGVAQGLNAANLGRQSTDYAKSALQQATQAYDAKAPLRAAGISNMTNVLGTPAPTTSALSQIAARSPFAARG